MGVILNAAPLRSFLFCFVILVIYSSTRRKRQLIPLHDKHFVDIVDIQKYVRTMGLSDQRYCKNQTARLKRIAD